MAGYNYNSIVGRQEAEALKEMIFKRARERAESLTQDVQDEYTSSAQNDVMEIARNSFNASRNPFSFSEVKPVEKTETKREDVGFPPRKIESVPESPSESSLKATNDRIIKNTIESNMAEAGSALRQKQSFMGALNFLNAQASVALVKKSGKSFEALA